MNARQKAKDLVAQAVHPNTPENLAIRSAMKACQIIHEHDLLSSPLEGIKESIDSETVRAAVDIGQRLIDPGFMRSLKTIGRSVKRGRR
jgi:hypothetical protein